MTEASFAITTETLLALRVERLTFDPGARVAEAAGQGPVLLQAEAGGLVVKPHAGADVRLVAGESLVLPAGSRFALWNERRDRTRMVVATVVASIVSNVAYFPPNGAGTPPPHPYPSGVTGELLAGSVLVPLPVGAASLALGHAALAPGGRLALPALDGPTAITVTTGNVRLASAEAVWVRRQDVGAITTATEAVLATGDSAHHLVSPPALALRNTGDEPAEVLVVVLRPASAGGTSGERTAQ
jgi:hypothetical protein